MEIDKNEQVYAQLSVTFAILAILSFIYLTTIVPGPTGLFEILTLSPDTVIRGFHTFSILGLTTTVLSIMNQEKVSWVKVLGIVLNSLILVFFIGGIILYLVFK